MGLVNALDEGLQLGRPMGKHHIRLIDPIEALLLGAQIADDRRTTDAFEKMLKTEDRWMLDERNLNDEDVAFFVERALSSGQ